ncbi:MAG: bifunctional diaminohydroxyphosphoribosylaminopyrimidine deaminase/5-amino-6-(5-phosphoribosylamino)uracil reductase RibD [Brumimicrobium sp.]|nr:bifunctional diaminohydroxyphosphoribosylaminopyrimidine deaminase/5-amino-6-(5-phosphoribosylamino)uracil reductase RibD [Brumimicrobium sp.]
MTQKDQDIFYMQRALELARLGGINVAPNPMVGAVVVSNNKIIGEGYHRNYGGPHAEVDAIEMVPVSEDLSEATIYVTLEPCAHFGKTPPCADLIVKHKLKRVVIACMDPYSEVAGKGIEKIRNAGISVDVGVLEKEARELNKRFFTFHNENRPYVILKWAQTEDGFMDRLPEDRKPGINWITGEETKKYVHEWRSREQAIMVGWKTVANDDPQLNVRLCDGPSPHRFIIDPHCKTPLTSKVIQDGNTSTIFVEKNLFPALPENVVVHELTKFTVQDILVALHGKSILSVFIEGGAETLSNFIQQGLWDEARVLMGSVNFERGIKAPELRVDPISRETLKNDTLLHFLNQ